MNKKMIFFDIDGTIKDTDNGMIYPSTIEAIKRLHDAGHIIVIASGRNMCLDKLINPIIPYIDAYILVNGSMVIYNGEIIYKQLMKKEELKRLTDDFDKWNITYSTISKDDSRINREDKEVFQMYIDWDIHVPKVDVNFADKEEIYQCWAFTTRGDINPVIKRHPEFSFYQWFKDAPGYDITASGISKGKSVKFLASYLNIDIKDTIAVGDSDNDISMFECVGFSIAMGNGTDAVKNIASIVTDDINKDGLFNAFKNINLI